MIEKQITVLQAEEGMALKKGDIICSSVMLRFGETKEGWIEIPAPIEEVEEGD